MWRGMLNGLLVLGCLAMTGCVTRSGPLMVSPVTSFAAVSHNREGIKQYQAGKWQDAKRHFESAMQADPDLPEVHFNLALTLHKLGDHEQARSHFNRARDMAPDNTAVAESMVSRNHLGLSSTFERHLSGGYRY